MLKQVCVRGLKFNPMHAYRHNVHMSKDNFYIVQRHYYICPKTLCKLGEPKHEEKIQTQRRTPQILARS